MPSLTVAAIKAATADRPRKLFDSGGLYLYVSPTGAKTWRLQFRVAGKQQQRSLGPWPEVSLAEARQATLEARQALRQGQDIRKPRSKAKPTLAACCEAYWAGRKDVTARYIGNAERAIAAHLKPILDLPVDQVTRENLLEALGPLNEDSKFVYVRRVRMWIGQVLEWAVEQGHRAGNPAAEIKPSKAFGRRRRQSFAALELADVPAFLKRLAVEDDLQSVRAMKVLALTWLRTGELRMLQWGDIIGDQILIPEGRMKRRRDHLVPLSWQALALLEEQRRYTGAYRFVFVSAHDVDRPISENAILALLDRMGYAGRMTGHGFRSVGSTWANDREMLPDAIERQLAHVPADATRAAYNRAAYLTQRREILQAYADWLVLQGLQCPPRPARAGASRESAASGDTSSRGSSPAGAAVQDSAP